MRQPYPNELYHHGIKGQKWGVRRYQNADGTLTAAGKKHLGIDTDGPVRKLRGENEMERHYASEEKYYTNRINKLNKKEEKAIAKGKTDKVVRIREKKAEADAALDELSKKADAYYSKDAAGRRKMEQGFRLAQTVEYLGWSYGMMSDNPAASSAILAGSDYLSDWIKDKMS